MFHYHQFSWDMSIECPWWGIWRKRGQRDDGPVAQFAKVWHFFIHDLLPSCNLDEWMHEPLCRNSGSLLTVEDPSVAVAMKSTRRSLTMDWYFMYSGVSGTTRFMLMYRTRSTSLSSYASCWCTGLVQRHCLRTWWCSCHSHSDIVALCLWR